MVSRFSINNESFDINIQTLLMRRYINAMNQHSPDQLK